MPLLMDAQMHITTLGACRLAVEVQMRSSQEHCWFASLPCCPCWSALVSHVEEIALYVSLCTPCAPIPLVELRWYGCLLASRVEEDRMDSRRRHEILHA